MVGHHLGKAALEVGAIWKIKIAVVGIGDIYCFRIGLPMPEDISISPF